MALPSKYGIEKSLNSMAGLSAYENGGPGSGNFGHAGRPGQRGGSGKGTGASKYDVPASIMDAYATSSSKYNDPEKMEIFTTPKGNLNLRYDGKDVSTISGSNYSDETLESLREQGILKDGSGTGEIKMPERAKDPHDWFKTVQEIKKGATEERRKELDKVVDEVSEAIYETGESYTGSKKKTLDFIEANILFHADTDNFDADAFLDVASEWLDDYKRVKASKAKKFRITENPMSGTDVVIEEVKDKK